MGVGFVSYNAVPPPPTGLFSPLKFDLFNSGLEEFQQPEFEGYGPKPSKSVSEDISNKFRESPDAPLVEELVLDDKLEKKTISPTVAKIEFVRPKQKEKPGKLTAITIKGKGWNMVSRAVLMKSGLRSLNTARPVNTTHPKTTVYNARPMPKAVNTARPNSAVVNAVRENQVNAVKASSHPQKEDQGYVDSGCSRHMIGNMSYLSDLKEFDGGYVTFGGGAKGGKITSKGTLITSKLDFEDVYFVKELQFNLFSISQMCDKKNNVLFTDTGCFVLSLDFKLADEIQVLLKVPRKNNMYSVDIKNIIPKESLSCLVAKATLDESMLWHRRLGHISKIELRVSFVKKGIKKEFSVARTPQQNSVTERRNRTLIETARTMLADSKLPTIFWYEVVNTACYVQNRVLVVKPHNKTPYELFRGRTPALSFMRPFGCHVTIVNTLDYLGKFDGKTDEGFLVGYSMNNMAFRVYNIRTRKLEENLHIRFLEDKPIIVGDGPKWLFDIDVLTKSMNYMPVVTGTNSNDLVGTEESIGNTSNDEPQPSSDARKKDDEGVSKETGIDDQERPKNSSQYVNTTGPSINTANSNANSDHAPLEATHADFFSNEAKVDMSNITTTYPVPSTPNTRIHKDHSLDHVIGDV
ncbi:ribonuclease H-like domain-containing protein [Tanacetum coccineum]|uniref:Ribonuclease H-like domain-containing protein n=1 Tax=Tanacetum coccineum TaxID=301880 RepID=A0ABQ5FNW5_9ASTR